MDRAVFINYRGEDSHSYGALLYTELVRQFGEDHVFLDAECIPATAELPVEIAALSRCQYRRLRYREPTADLARIVTDLVSMDPLLAETARRRGGAPRGQSVAAAMFSMRGDIPDFVGRQDELRVLLDAVVAAANGPVRGIAVHTVDGMPGVGKTTFSVHAAHHLADRFPDGQIFLELYGHSPTQAPATRPMPWPPCWSPPAWTGPPSRKRWMIGRGCGGTGSPARGSCSCWTTRPVTTNSAPCSPAPPTASW